MLDSIVESITDPDIKVIPILKKVCMCGCGSVIDALDSQGRPRYYILGHNRRGRKRDRTIIEISKIKTLEEAQSYLAVQATIIKDQAAYIDKLEQRQQLSQ